MTTYGVWFFIFLGLALGAAGFMSGPALLAALWLCGQGMFVSIWAGRPA
jgi:hypothetical protein